LVIGATVHLSELGLDGLNHDAPTLRTPLLAPGFGFQGAQLSDAKKIFTSISGDVVYTISRSALRDGLAGVKNAVRMDQETLTRALSE
jgi:orotidine-5'-phosphate decarboxylase